MDSSSSSEEYVSAEEGPGENEGSLLGNSSEKVEVETVPLSLPQLEVGEEEVVHHDSPPTTAVSSPKGDVPPPENEPEPSFQDENENTTFHFTEVGPNEGVVETAVEQVPVHHVSGPEPVPASPTPVPPPRRKRKKKYDKSSLENLAEVDDRQQLQRRSYTISGTNPRKDLESSLQASVSSPDSDNTPERDVGGEEEAGLGVALLVSGPNPHTVGTIKSGLASQDHVTDRNQQLLQNMTIEDRSRSNTPTPAISIQPEVEWTSGVLSGPENEMVTFDTTLTKARGSTSTASVLFASDEDSADGLEEVDRDEEELAFVDSPYEGEDDGKGNTNTQIDGMEHAQSERTTSPVDADKAILMSTMVKNLDTGEVIPLSAAEERIPQGHGWSPLSEHLIRRTKEMAEAEGAMSYEDDDVSHRRRPPRRTGFKKLKWGRKKERMACDVGIGLAEEVMAEDHSTVKYKQSHKQQGKAEFERIRLKQDLTGTHIGAIWTMEFSICGRLLATAGQDSVVRVWVLATASHFFHELQAQYQRLGVHSSVDSLSERASVASGSSKSSEEDDVAGGKLPFQDQPLCSYCGHTSDVLDLSWSKNFFLLSSSMDKTVRLWHISRKECLCCFQHVDFVTAIAFHPRDDRYFLSGSLDGKLRLWNIPDKRVALWNEIEGVGSHLITAANFCMNGKLAVVGTYDGRCIFYDTEHLKYHTQIHVKSRHGKNKGRKISGVEPLPGEDKLLVTSNDSRVRLYNLKDHELSCKYKGYLNTSSQIKATFSRDGQYVITGSEDNYIYIWKTHLDLSKLSSARRDRNEFYESFTAHSAPITTAVFAPVPGITVDEGIREVGEMVVAADYQGCIKIYVSGEQL